MFTQCIQMFCTKITFFYPCRTGIDKPYLSISMHNMYAYTLLKRSYLSLCGNLNLEDSILSHIHFIPSRAQVSGL